MSSLPERDEAWYFYFVETAGMDDRLRRSNWCNGRELV